MTGRLVRSEDFERVLQSPTRARSVHFAVHHVASEPSCPRRPAGLRNKGAATDLSTGEVRQVSPAVDELPVLPAQPSRPTALWIGVVVPKRHAKRSVTRSLLKREMRQAVAGQSDALGGGLWVVRLRSGFDRKVYPSAASAPLRLAARTELAELMRQAARRGAPR